jgi:DNA processing protein
MQHVDLNNYFTLRTQVPETLYIIGSLPPPEYKRIVIVGTRKPSSYGIASTHKIIAGLKGYPISLISGLALGIDAIVHQAALDSGLHTIAFPGSGLSEEVIYPRSNVNLSKRIIASGGALISPWEKHSAAPWTFPVRNRIMASIADFVLVIEATTDSGTLITANAAVELGIPLGALPGNIDSALSTGSNNLLKEGAHCITCASDLLGYIGINARGSHTQTQSLFDETNPLLLHISEPMHKDKLMRLTQLSSAELNSEITLLELSGMISIDAQGMIRKK